MSSPLRHDQGKETRVTYGFFFSFPVSLLLFFQVGASVTHHQPGGGGEARKDTHQHVRKRKRTKYFFVLSPNRSLNQDTFLKDTFKEFREISYCDRLVLFCFRTAKTLEINRVQDKVKGNKEERDGRETE